MNKAPLLASLTLAFSLAGCADYHNEAIEAEFLRESVSCSSALPGSPNVVQLETILRTMLEEADRNDDGAVNIGTYGEIKEGTAIDALRDNQVKICLGPEQMSDSISYDFQQRILYVNPAISAQQAGLALFNYIMNRNEEFWTLGTQPNPAP